MKALQCALLISIMTTVMCSIWDHKKCLSFCRPSRANSTNCGVGCKCHPFRYMPLIGGCLDVTLPVPWMFRPLRRFLGK
uniref:Mucin n=1 Tax=Rhipicephalus zambeziensis TaxID=60191 RepID=A0A224YD39_9ACAR